ncbi:MAG: pitrilysin family protein [Candidatus Omnitrophica bacterium]|nr:pitrilysin family protein [Candidatus Omnitrophota bacterium]
MSQYQKKVLDNGLKIITCRMPARHSVSLGVWIKVGGRYEDFRNKGISHFLEHLLFKGTKRYTCHQLKESIEGVGGSLNGFTSEELTCYLVKMPGVYLERALSVLSDMVINPTLPKNEIEKEKAVILEELKMYKDLPQSYVYELLDELLWSNQPLGAPIIGTVESVTSINRVALVAFKEKYYTPSNIVISAAGDLEYKKIEEGVVKIFGRLKAKNTGRFLGAKEAQSKAQLKVFAKDTEQTHMALGFRAFRREHPLKHALSMLHIILGANMSSRLFNEIREKKGLAYEIGTLVKRFQDTGAFIVHAGIDNQKINKAIPLILRELEKTKAKLVSEDEFSRAKEFYIGQLRLGLEDTLEHMLWIGETTATLDKIYLLEEIIQEVNRVTRKDIREVACRLFNDDNLNLALIGPLKNKEAKISKLLRLD